MIVRFTDLESDTNLELWKCKCSDVVVASIVVFLTLEHKVHESVLVSYRSNLKAEDKTLVERIFNTCCQATAESEELTSAL